MKKYILSVLFLIPCVSFGAPSVRVLGTQNANIKAAPVKAVSVNKVNQTAPVRTGTLRNKNSGVSGVLTSSGSRFPVISNAKIYNSVTQPASGGSGSGSAGGTTISDTTINQITQEITNNVLTTVQNDYYNKNEVYNVNEVYNKEEINNIIEDVRNVDDPRIDAIRIGNPAGDHSEPLDTNHVYVWIEQ